MNPQRDRHTQARGRNSEDIRPPAVCYLIGVFVLNGTLASNVKRKLYPALEQSQGFTGDYSRQGRHASLTAIPTTPEWMASEDTGLIEEWIGLVWMVSVDEWSRTGFDEPTRNDRFTVTMADGVLHRFAVLAPKGLREYDMPAGGHGYNIRMKWVKE